MDYGVPYQGSKRKIAKRIILVLPSGERFVDLFGGGAAMTCAAMVSGKYKSVLYNDINPLLPPFIKNVLNGDYNDDKFTPEWVARSDFSRLKDSDGYIKYVWSFGNNGEGYLFGKDVEPLKHVVHDFIVFGKESEELYKIMPKQYCHMITGDSIRKRRLQWSRMCKVLCKRVDVERLQQLQFSNISYEEYRYKEGDVCYCDPPYEDAGTKGCDDYGGWFDSKKFYNWVYDADFPVWFSSYKISDNRFDLVWAKRTRSTMCSTNKNKVVYECLYANKKALEMMRIEG